MDQDVTLVELDRATCELVGLPVTVDRDPDGLTLKVALGPPATAEFEDWAWTGPATRVEDEKGVRWLRTGRRMLAGPDAEPSNATPTTVLTLGFHRVRWQLTGSTETPVRDAGIVEVR